MFLKPFCAFTLYFRFQHQSEIVHAILLSVVRFFLLKVLSIFSLKPCRGIKVDAVLIALREVAEKTSMVRAVTEQK